MWRLQCAAKGVIFVLAEGRDGRGPGDRLEYIRARQRNALLHARLLAVHGTWQREGAVCSQVAQQLEDLTPLLGGLATVSRNFG